MHYCILYYYLYSQCTYTLTVYASVLLVVLDPHLSIASLQCAHKWSTSDVTHQCSQNVLVAE